MTTSRCSACVRSCGGLFLAGLVALASPVGWAQSDAPDSTAAESTGVSIETPEVGAASPATQRAGSEAKDSGTRDSFYTDGPASPYGIGKYYQGREIARVMSHLGADWLERPERALEERPDEMIAALPLERNSVVADIGAGSGYLTFKLSARVPDGKVFAVDIQPEMLERLVKERDQRGVTNVKTVLGTERDPRLTQDSIDLALMVDAYHEFAYPREMMQGLMRALRPGGYVALVEYRGEDPRVPILPTHKMTQAQVKKEMRAVGFDYVRTYDALPQQHLMLFAKPTAAADGEKTSSQGESSSH